MGLQVASENQLVDLFKNKLYNELSNIKIFEEIETSWGRPDLLVVHYNSDRLYKRLNRLSNRKLPHFNNLSSYAISYLQQYKNGTTLNKIKKLIKIKNGEFNKIIDCLVQRGLVSVYGNKTIRMKSSSNIFLIDRIQVFEAKLNDWKKAISQAQRHLWFTNESYILKSKVNSDETFNSILKSCIKSGIGFVLHKDSGIFEITLTPERCDVFNSPISWRINELLLDEVLYYE